MSRSPSFKGLSPASPAASRVGRANSGRGTRPERLLRSALWRRGLRFRIDYDQLPGRPDIALPRRKIAIFCDGDFWHGRDWDARRVRLSKGQNGAYWTAKIERNIERDRDVDQALTHLGWSVFRVWESEILADVTAVAERLLAAIQVCSTSA